MMNIHYPKLYIIFRYFLDVSGLVNQYTTSNGDLSWLAKRKRAIIAELVLWNVAYNLLAKRHKWDAQQRSSLDYRQTSSQ